ncbi:MAG: IS4 family transposase [Opitutaceae bacterium]|nr:IS4 family transposase [Opitutaceae bacterium]
MKKPNSSHPSRPQATVLRQLVELIPAHLVPQLARTHDVDRQARTFSPWSHVVALLYAQLSHALSLNDVCDGLRLWATPLRALRGATPPSRNALSHANHLRSSALAEQLFWRVLGHLQRSFPRFGRGATRGLAWRFRRTIHVVDATVIQLVAGCLDWARHNRRKAAAKCHLRLGLRSLLPGFVVVGSARESELARVRALCAGLREGEIVLFDRGYHWLAHFWELTQRGVFFVTRPKEKLGLRVVQRLPRGADPRILRDDLVVTTGGWVRGDYPGRLRRVTARVVVDGEERVMEFLTNNLTWGAASVAGLYRCRWQIEAFFKQIKQTLQLADFLGRSANAVQWQVWTALLAYVLLRFQAWCGAWAHSFARLCCVLRAALWQRRDLAQLLRRYGTAGGDCALLAPLRQGWLPGFAA